MRRSSLRCFSVILYLHDQGDRPFHDNVVREATFTPPDDPNAKRVSTTTAITSYWQGAPEGDHTLRFVWFNPSTNAYYDEATSSTVHLTLDAMGRGNVVLQNVSIPTVAQRTELWLIAQHQDGDAWVDSACHWLLYFTPTPKLTSQLH